MSGRGAAAVGALLLAGVAGCEMVAAPITGQITNPQAIPPIVQVLAGQSPTGPFRGMAYRTSDGWTCLEIVGRAGGSSCGNGDDALLGAGWSSSGDNEAGMVTGGTKAPGAAAVRLRLDDGTVVAGTLGRVPAPIAPPNVSVYVVVLPAGRAPTQVDILDGAGTVLESTSF
ncbi:MAG TPA: hypothetical protein VFL03_04750 [Candidatus Limnocylindrales bacterium]|nr:hypothetical protein [Candidatus Limnocylindrales bacterium]